MYSFESRVRYSECDETGRLSLVSMMDYLQDCSTFQCEDLGEGIAALKDQGFGWILASWRIEISHLPLFGEKIRISTWCYGLRRLQAHRCFQICDEAGNPLVTADSQWFLFDLRNLKIAHIPESQLFYLEDTPRAEMGAMEKKLTHTSEARATSPITVGPQHLDSNEHVNNAQYVLFAIRALAELGIEGAADVMSIQYRSMARLGDTVTPAVYDCEGGHVVELLGADSAVYAIVKLQGK